MGRKTNKDKADELLSKLSKKDILELLEKYSAREDFSAIEEQLKVKCPNCDSEARTHQGKTKY